MTEKPKHLTLVPPAEPDAKTAMIERIKARGRPHPGVLQCPKCGGRAVMTVVNGSWIDESGRYRRGTMIEDRICYICDKKGIWSPMMPPVFKVAKEPKPRRTKPKAVK